MWLVAAVLHLALLTSDRYPPSAKIDDKLLTQALQEYAIEQNLSTHSSTVDWKAYDAVMVYSSWDYYENHAQFMSLLKKSKV